MMILSRLKKGGKIRECFSNVRDRLCIAGFDSIRALHAFSYYALHQKCTARLIFFCYMHSTVCEEEASWRVRITRLRGDPSLDPSGVDQDAVVKRHLSMKEEEPSE